MKLEIPYIDRIWRVRSSVSIEEELSPSDGFERMSPLFRTQNTEVILDGDTLTYSKTNPAAQDKLATFTSGTLHLSAGGGQTTLNYDVKSTALALCFLAPLLFLGFAGIAAGLNTLDPVVEDRAENAADGEEEKEVRELHWIDQMLGVPAPDSEDGEDDETNRNGEDEEEEEEEEDEGKHNPKPAYALAGIFAVIFLVGRILEPYLLRRTFRTALRGGFIATPMGAVLREKLDAYTEEAIPRSALQLPDDAAPSRDG